MYGPDLAAHHDEHDAEVALAGADVLLDALREAGWRGGRVADVGAAGAARPRSCSRPAST